MYVSRTLHLGLVVFAVTLLVSVIVEKRSRDADPVPVAATYQPVTVVDVSRTVHPSDLSTLVRLRADERVAAVNDRAVANDLAAGAAIAEQAPGAGRFLDLTVTGAQGSRRVLVLLH
jgi:hypothetical protein